jgi:hypothetical protein
VTPLALPYISKTASPEVLPFASRSTKATTGLQHTGATTDAARAQHVPQDEALVRGKHSPSPKVPVVRVWQVSQLDPTPDIQHSSATQALRQKQA